MILLLLFALAAAPPVGGAAFVVPGFGPAAGIGLDPRFCHPAGGEAPPAGALQGAAQLLADGRLQPERASRMAYFNRVRQAAEARIAEDPGDLEARWWRIAAMGLLVDEEGARGKVQLAGAIRDEAEVLLAKDPEHPGAHHALGRLHSGVVRLNPILRFFALRLFGEGELARASWAEAEHHLIRARDAVPCSLIHRWELSRSYAYQGKNEAALSELEALLALPDRAPQDPEVREMAEALREEVRRRR